MASSLLVPILLLAAPGDARAAGPELRYDPTVDGAVTLGAGALWITSELLKGSLAAPTCRWCEPNGLDTSVRNALRSKDDASVDTASNILGFFVVPLVTLGTEALAAKADGRLQSFTADALIISEATVIAADVNQLTKFIVGRERPYVHDLTPDQKTQTPQPSDNNTSFFSGHTTLAFTLATASGTVASMRDYRGAPAVWGVGLSLAVLSGYLRIAADKHYFTDVLTGAIVGGGIGFALPYVFHRPSSGVPVAPGSGATGLSGAVVSGVF